MMPLLPTGRQGAPGQPCRQAWLQPSPGTEPSQATEPTLLNGHLKGKETVELAAGRQGHTHTPGLCFTPFLRRTATNLGSSTRKNTEIGCSVLRGAPGTYTQSLLLSLGPQSPQGTSVPRRCFPLPCVTSQVECKAK